MASVLVITGGSSSEREISLKSAKQVISALKKKGFSVKAFDLLKGYEELKEISPNFDVLFPVLHGEEGEGGKLHKFLSSLNKPVVGTKNYKALKEGWYKIPFKKFCDDNNFPTSDWREVRNTKDIVEFGFPSVLKGSAGGSSLEVAILQNADDLKPKSVRDILSSGQPIFVERYLKGIEVTVGILNKAALPVVEIVPPNNDWFSYENKYTPMTQEIPNAPSLPLAVRKRVQKLAYKIHSKLEIGSYSRIDFIVVNTKPFVLEVNTIPGLTAESLLPKAALAAGISFPDFVETLVNLAKRG